ncbi:DUF2628 domain-containing protein [Thioalkalivibrio sp.]|uniref:DUF2628 domain-containing protein n=1 Tax=Thioalkalivibrio sp. TaxID=2093813 RepID=UPI00356976D0
MKTFDVYMHRTHGLHAVKKGFAWPACFFTFIWAFIKRMWGVGFGILGVFFVLSFLEALFSQSGSEVGAFLVFVSQLAVFVIVGAKGNNWLRRSLERRGFQRFTSVRADTPDQAIDAAAQKVQAGVSEFDS